MKHTRNTKLLTLLMLATLAVLACSITPFLGDTQTVRGLGNVIEESRDVSGISGVNLATLGHLIIEVGDTEALRVEAEDNLMEYLETTVLNGTLRIKFQDDIRIENTEPVNYYLTVRSLDTIMISSSGDITAPDLEAEQFSITINSSGDLEMGVLSADTLEVDIGSSGNLYIAGGEVRTQNITINSSGNYTAEELASDEAEVQLNSDGSATIWVNNQLTAILRSSGDLSYRGNPTVDATTDSSGDVIKIGE